MDLKDDDIQHGWQVGKMPQARVQLDSLLIPTGDVLIVYRGGTGITGHRNVKNQIVTPTRIAQFSLLLFIDLMSR